MVEIGTEELPPKALATLSEAFTQGIDEQLTQFGLSRDRIKSYATPRRLAVLVERLDTAQADKETERRGPALQAAYDAEGIPTKAAEGFARSCGVAVADLEESQTAKGAWLVYRQTEPGRPTRELLPEIVEKSLARLPIPKRMRWGSGNEEFVRPVHWVVLLFGEDVVPGQNHGSGDRQDYSGSSFPPSGTDRHRPTGPITAGLLKQSGHVIADLTERKALIEQSSQ